MELKPMQANDLWVALEIAETAGVPVILQAAELRMLLEKVDKLQAEVTRRGEQLSSILGLIIGYDGLNTVASLRGLIDEIMDVCESGPMGYEDDDCARQAALVAG